MTERYAKEGFICNPVPYQQCQNGHTYVELAPLAEPHGYTYVELAATAEPDGYAYVELAPTAEPNGYIYTECNGTATVGTAYIPNPPPFIRYSGTCYQYTGTSNTPQGITISDGYTAQGPCETPSEYVNVVCTSEMQAQLPTTVTLTVPQLTEAQCANCSGLAVADYGNCQQSTALETVALSRNSSCCGYQTNFSPVCWQETHSGNNITCCRNRMGKYLFRSANITFEAVRGWTLNIVAEGGSWGITVFTGVRRAASPVGTYTRTSNSCSTLASATIS